MKKHLLFAFALAALVLAGCKPEPVPEPEPDDDQYGDVYFPQAASNPNAMEVTEEMTDAVKVQVSLFLGGFKAAKEDITAEVEVNADLVATFNAANEAECIALPAGTYSFDATSVTIKAGSNSSDYAYVTVDIASLEKGKDYILPIQIKSCTYTKIDAEKAVVYYQFNVAPEKVVPPTPETDVVLSFGAKAKGCLFQGVGSDIIFIDADRNYNLYVYKAGEDGLYYPGYNGVEKGQGWVVDGHAFETCCVEPYTMCFRYGDTYQEFSFFDDYTAWQGAIIGVAGWAVLKQLFEYGNKTLFTVQPDNSLTHYQFYNVDSYATTHWVLVYEGVLVDNTEDWSQYKLFCCGDKILGVTAAGQMYSWDITASADNLGVLTVTVGEKKTLTDGWDKYDHLFEVEGSIMAVDENGDVHKFDVPSGK